MSEQGNKFFADFQEALLALDSRVSQMKSIDDLSVDDWCQMILEISNFKTQLSFIYETVTGCALDAMDETEIVSLPSGDTIEKKWSKDRKGWKHKELAEVVAERIQDSSVDLDTGERVLSVHEMIKKMLEYVQPSYWRVSALSDIGINADDYCQAGDSKPSISVKRAK